MKIIEIANILIGLTLIIAGICTFLYVIKQANNEAKSEKHYLWLTLAAIAIFIMGIAAVYDAIASYYMFSL